MGEEVNNGIYEFETLALQKIGVINARVKVKFGVDFVKRFSEIVGETARIAQTYDGRIYFNTTKFFDENVIHETIRRDAVIKILREGVPRREYHVVLSEEDVDFSDIEKETEKARKARKLLDEIAKEKERLKNAKVIQDYYVDGIILVDGSRCSTYAYSVEELEKVLEKLRSIDPDQLLRNVIEKQRKEIEELEQRIRELRAENEELRDRLERLEDEKDDEEDDEEDCWEDDDDDEDEDYW